MKQIIAILLVMMSHQANAQDLLIKNIKVFDGFHDSVLTKDVFIADGEIVEIGDGLSVPKVRTIIDATGKDWTLMPGLFDLHTHLGGAGAYFFDNILINPVDNLRTQLWSGVTTVIDLHMTPELMEQLRNAGETEPLPNMYFAGPAFTATNGHGSQFPGMIARTVDYDGDIDEQWRNHLFQEPDVTKLILENATWLRFPQQPVNEWPTLTTQHFREIATRSRQAGLPTFAHIWTNEDALAAAQNGAEVLAHGVFTAEISERVVKALQEHSVTYVPTLAVVLNTRKMSEPGYWTRFPVEDVLCPTLYESLTNEENINLAQEYNLTNGSLLGPNERFLGNVKKVFDADINIGIGTDTGNSGVLQGPGVHREIDYYVEAGIPLTEVMKMATSGSAAALGEKGKDLGRINRGYRADLVIVEGNPLTDVTAHNKIVRVIKGGKVVDRNALVRITQRDGCGKRL